MTSKSSLALIAALLLVAPLMAGCVGGDDAPTNGTGTGPGSTNDSGADGQDGDAGAGSGSNQSSGDTGGDDQAPRPSNENAWTDSATVGVPYGFVGAASAAEFTRMSIENGANGTYVLAYNFNVPDGVKKLTVTATASAVAGGAPDYDLFVWNETGGLRGGSTNQGTDETVEVDRPTGGQFLIGLLYWAGADAEESVAPVTINATAR